MVRLYFALPYLTLAMKVFLDLHGHVNMTHTG